MPRDEQKQCDHLLNHMAELVKKDDPSEVAQPSDQDLDLRRLDENDRKDILEGVKEDSAQSKRRPADDRLPRTLGMALQLGCHTDCLEMF